jgi:hypothetical protein
MMQGKPLKKSYVDYEGNAMVRLRPIFPSPLYLIIFAVTLYVVLAWLLPNPPYFEFLRIIAQSIAIIPVVGYWRLAFRNITREYPDHAQQLMQSIVLFCLAQFLSDLWQLIWRLADRPHWWLDTTIYGFFIYLTIWAALLASTSPGAVRGKVPTRNLMFIGAAWGVGFALFLVLVWFRLDASKLVEATRPFLLGR